MKKKLLLVGMVLNSASLLASGAQMVPPPAHSPFSPGFQSVPPAGPIANNTQSLMQQNQDLMKEIRRLEMRLQTLSNQNIPPTAGVSFDKVAMFKLIKNLINDAKIANKNADSIHGPNEKRRKTILDRTQGIINKAKKIAEMLNIKL